MNDKDRMAERCLKALGIEKNMMQRSAGGGTWYPKGEFVPPTRRGLVYNSERGMLTGFRRDAVYALLPGGLAVRKTAANPQWHGFRPKYFPTGRRMNNAEFNRVDSISSELLRSEPSWKRRDLALRQYMRDVIGKEAAAVVVGCKESVGWGILRSLVVSPCSIDTPPAFLALAYYHYLFSPDRKTTNPSRVMRRLLRCKRMHLLEHNGFDPRASKVLARVAACDMSLRLLFNLREVLKNADILKLLLHMHGTVTLNVLNALQIHPFLLTPCLLEEIGNRKRSVFIGGKISDIGELRHALGLVPLSRPFKSIKAVNQMHDDLVMDLNMRNALPLAPFPPPPMADQAIEVAGDDESRKIVVNCHFITSHSELLAHGRFCRNCSGSYGRYVSEGRACMLEVWSQVNRKDMHTVCLARRKDGLWCLSEIAKRVHVQPEPWALAAVKQLLLANPGIGVSGADMGGAGSCDSLEVDDNLPF